MQDHYQEIYQSHRWDVPERFNMAWACCGRHVVDSHHLSGSGLPNPD